MFIWIESINVRDFVDETLPFLVVQLVLVRYVRSEVHSIHFLYSTIHLHSRRQRCLQTQTRQRHSTERIPQTCLPTQNHGHAPAWWRGDVTLHRDSIWRCDWQLNQKLTETKTNTKRAWKSRCPEVSPMTGTPRDTAKLLRLYRHSYVKTWCQFTLWRRSSFVNLNLWNSSL